MNRLEEYVNMAKLNDLVGKKEAEKKVNPLITGLAIIGMIVSVVAIAFAIYKYLVPDYFGDYDDFEDDFDDFEDLEEEEFEFEMQDDLGDVQEETILGEESTEQQ